MASFLASRSLCQHINGHLRHQDHATDPILNDFFSIFLTIMIFAIIDILSVVAFFLQQKLFKLINANIGSASLMTGVSFVSTSVLPVWQSGIPKDLCNDLVGTSCDRKLLLYLLGHSEQCFLPLYHLFENPYFSAMRTASVSELKQELVNTPHAELIDLCVRLIKYKKENKELLTYLLFESHDEQGYIENVKADMNEQFLTVNRGNVYFAKKSLRKILRTTAKYIKYTGTKQAEAELLIYFCTLLKGAGIALYKSTALTNLYEQQLKKINRTVASMHEDLQYEYLKEMEKILLP